MMRSMFSAVSGLRAHQTRMDVIGNNIANVNTVGFKGSRVTFQEVFSQTLRGAGSPQGGKGGTNPQQVGLGINVASMDTFHIRGAVERTDYNTDLMINGDGFFIVADDPNFLNRSFTRAGNFTLDEAGNLVTADGFRVLGYMADNNGVLRSSLEGLQISRAVSFDAQQTTRVLMEGNINSEVPIFPGGGDNIIGQGGNFIYDADDNYRINPNFENMVARETTFQVYDSLGGIHRIKLAFIKTEVDTSGTSPISTYAVAAFYVDENGNKSEFTLNGASFAHEITFNANGRVVEGESFSLTVEPTNGANTFTFPIDLSRLTMFANTSTVSADKIDGFKQGTLADFTIAATGEITGIFDNGKTRILGQIALANFKNPAGLEKTSSNMYRTTSNSGQAIIGVPGSGGFGNLNPGALEMSNVDLSREFTNMITTQRGFQANSRIITASDEMLQEVVNMKR